VCETVGGGDDERLEGVRGVEPVLFDDGEAKPESLVPATVPQPSAEAAPVARPVVGLPRLEPVRARATSDAERWRSTGSATAQRQHAVFPGT
jgi:hypothetical protein